MNISERIFKAEQEEGKRISAIKLPDWSSIEGLIFPQRLSMEQCSSQATANYKATLVHGEDFVDLTGGFGVDCAAISKSFNKSTYVEQQEKLCKIASHNFKLLGIDVQVENRDSVEYLTNMPKTSTIYIDPARRDTKGGKVVKISDCEPDICKLKETLLNKCDTLLIKLSPMLDISMALESFPETKEVHIVSVNNECKELLLLIENNSVNKHTEIKCINLPSDNIFSFTLDEEQKADTTFSMPKQYLYEPNSSIMKAGAFKSIAQKYNLYKIQSNSHLYTSDTLINNFPGRKFEIEDIYKAQKNETKNISKANISIRNFPTDVDSLRKKLKIKDGGDIYLFATTLCDDSHRIIRCKKI